MIEALPKELRKELVLYQNSDIKKEFLTGFDNYGLTPLSDGYLVVYTYDPPYQILNNKVACNLGCDALGISNLKSDSLLYVYGFRDGENDGPSWEVICRYQTSIGVKYVYYTAWCDYTGFDCRGGADIYLCDNYQALIHHCVTQGVCNELELDKFL